MDKQEIIEMIENKKEWLKLDKSYYCHNYFKYNDVIIFAKSDDDNETDYYVIDEDERYLFQFAYSRTSDNNELIYWFIDYTKQGI